MRAIDTLVRLSYADAYLARGQEDSRWDIVSDAIRLRCRILCEDGQPEYQVWKSDTCKLPRRP